MLPEATRLEGVATSLFDSHALLEGVAATPLFEGVAPTPPVRIGDTFATPRGLTFPLDSKGPPPLRGGVVSLSAGELHCSVSAMGCDAVGLLAAAVVLPLVGVMV